MTQKAMTIRLPEELFEKLAEAAETGKTTMADTARAAVAAYVCGPSLAEIAASVARVEAKLDLFAAATE